MNLYQEHENIKYIKFNNKEYYDFYIDFLFNYIKFSNFQIKIDNFREVENIINIDGNILEIVLK